MNEINWLLIAPIILLQLFLMIPALISCMKQEETNGPKWLWGLIILFVSTIGPILYFVLARKKQ
ncbi:PLD nuclease N-terminal domain-containing protein [Priestia aryabhattai]|uniref:PLDc N-terminal domain-containing protein n=1 Tax=Priestia aryabhattai TaxID=412384 RepID=UPI002041869E|nr:PLD nuclease N-terminal domain-containing protein [Priestia aryabhattai]MCM3770784.1 PLD nuclease N-terminal domain-containing protein [Priestia aryabhattai]